MPKEIQTKTLIDISKYTNKIIRLGRFMSESDSAYIVNKMAYINEDTDPLELLLAFDGDLNSTAKMLQNLQKVLETTVDGIAVELGDDGEDLTLLLPDAYDKTDNTITLFGYKISSKSSQPSNINELKSGLYYEIMPEECTVNYSYDDYKKHLSLLKSMNKKGAPTRNSPFHEALIYCGQLTSIKHYDKFYEFVVKSTDFYFNIRKDLKERDKSLIDQKIYGGRTMIDGVLKTSTYITSEDWMEDTIVSSAHKKDPLLISKIEKRIKEIPFIRAVEIDQDTSLLKFYDMLSDVKKLNLDIADTFELKSRKLGNYGASGMMATRDASNEFVLNQEWGFSSPKLSIVAVDVDAPTSLIHEIAHFRDKVNNDVRAAMVSHFGGMIDRGVLEDVLGDKIDYFFKDREIIARLGEVGFLLNKYGYKDGETVRDFTDRVALIEDAPATDAPSGKKFNVAINKSWSLYFADNNIIHQQIYFNLKYMVPLDLSVLRDYTHDFYFKQDPNIKKILLERVNSGDFNLNTSNQQYRAVRKKRFRELTSVENDRKAFGLLNEHTFIDTYNIGIKLGVFDDGEFTLALNHSSRFLFRGTSPKKTISYNDWQKQINALKQFVEVVDISERPADALIIERIFYNYMSNSNILPSNDLTCPNNLIKQDNMINSSLKSTECDMSMKLLGHDSWRSRTQTVGLKVLSDIANETIKFMSIKFRDEQFNTKIPVESLLTVSNKQVQLYAIIECAKKYFSLTLLPNVVEQSYDSEAYIQRVDSFYKKERVEYVKDAVLLNEKEFSSNICERKSVLAALQPELLMDDLFTHHNEKEIALYLLDKGVLDDFSVSDESVKSLLSSFNVYINEKHGIDNVVKTTNDPVVDLKTVFAFSDKQFYKDYPSTIMNKSLIYPSPLKSLCSLCLSNSPEREVELNNVIYGAFNNECIMEHIIDTLKVRLNDIFSKEMKRNTKNIPQNPFVLVVNDLLLNKGGAKILTDDLLTIVKKTIVDSYMLSSKESTMFLSERYSRDGSANFSHYNIDKSHTNKESRDLLFSHFQSFLTSYLDINAAKRLSKTFMDNVYTEVVPIKTRAENFMNQISVFDLKVVGAFMQGRQGFVHGKLLSYHMANDNTFNELKTLYKKITLPLLLNETLYDKHEMLWENKNQNIKEKEVKIKPIIKDDVKVVVTLDNGNISNKLTNKTSQMSLF